MIQWSDMPLQIGIFGRDARASAQPRRICTAILAVVFGWCRFDIHQCMNIFQASCAAVASRRPTGAMQERDVTSGESACR
jgi:hypothetical protein